MTQRRLVSVSIVVLVIASGDPWVPRSYAVIVDASTGGLLAWDDPSQDC